MIPIYKRKANIFVLLFIASLVIWIVIQVMSEGKSSVGPMFFYLGHVLLIIGCYYYAKGKGYGGVMGLLGLFSLLGLIILVGLPDKQKQPSEQNHL